MVVEKSVKCHAGAKVESLGIRGTGIKVIRCNLVKVSIASRFRDAVAY